MADQKLTQLTQATTPLTGTEQAYVVQSSASKRTTTQDIANLAPGTDLTFTQSTRVLASSTGADVTLPVATDALPGLMAAADKAKLDGVAAGATANSSDATLLNRANHTGTQAAGTITGLATVATTGAYADLSGRPTLGTAAATDATAYATAAQGAKADTAVQPAGLTGYVQTGDARLSDSREWSAATIDQAEVEAGTATTRRAFTAQRVFQAVAAWWAASAAKTKLDGIAAGATNTPLSDATPQAPGTAAAGTASSAARGDHVHPLPSLAALGAAASGAIASSGLTQSTARLLGRATAGTGAVEEITLGTGLSFTGTTLNATASGGGTKTLDRFTPLDNQPPAANFATLDTRNSIALLDFDAATEESAVFVGVIPEAANLTSGISVIISWAATSATSGDCVWGAQFEKTTGQDIDADSFDTATTATTTTNAASGFVNTTTITCTSIDSLAAGNCYRVKVYRAATAAGDTMTGDAELVAVELRQVA